MASQKFLEEQAKKKAAMKKEADLAKKRHDKPTYAEYYMNLSEKKQRALNKKLSKKKK